MSTSNQAFFIADFSICSPFRISELKVVAKRSKISQLEHALLCLRTLKIAKHFCFTKFELLNKYYKVDRVWVLFF